MPESAMTKTISILIALMAIFPAGVSAAEIFVHARNGNDRNAGTAESPLATAQRAVSLAQPGDCIHLLPENAIYRQSITLHGKTDLVIQGHGVTLDGADPLPADGWESVGGALHRRRLPRTFLDRHLLIVSGRMERMGRTQSSNSRPFPRPDQLQPGEFCFEQIDDQQGWLYVNGDVHQLEWAVRANGLATGGETARIVVRNLNARNFLNDGFNIHGHAVQLKFEHIRGYDCFDEGFSAHDQCQCEVDFGEFFGNENAVADVNDSETHYRHCEFRDSVSVDVLLVGAKHSLTDCRILNTTSATALSAGLHGVAGKPFELELTRVQILGRAGDRARVRIDGGKVQVLGCRMENVDWNVTGAEATYQDSSINGAERP